MRSPDIDRAPPERGRGQGERQDRRIDPADHSTDGAEKELETAVCFRLLSRIADNLDALVRQVRRIADHYDPPPPDVVDSGYVARKLDLTTTRIAELARDRQIPSSCIVPGTGDGKPWKFYRPRIDEWIASR
jgi:hypothetical protein